MAAFHELLETAHFLTARLVTYQSSPSRKLFHLLLQQNVHSHRFWRADVRQAQLIL